MRWGEFMQRQEANSEKIEALRKIRAFYTTQLEIAKQKIIEIDKELKT